MSNTILASELSPFSARLRIACALKSLDYVFEPPPGGSGSSELKVITAFGRIPVLVSDAHVLVESLALLDYLEDAHPAARTLLPGDASGRARVRMISLLFDHNVVKALGAVFAQLAKPVPDVAAAHTAFDDVTVEIGKLVSYFDATGPAVGDRWSTADCAMAPFAFLMDALASAFGAGSPTARVPRFQVWWAKLAELPEVSSVTVRMQRALAAMTAAKKVKENSEEGGVR